MPAQEFAYATPNQKNAYGPRFEPDSSRFAHDMGPGMQQEDMPSRIDREAGGNLTPEQNERYLAARKAGTAAQENMNEARGVPRLTTKPEDATDYAGY